MAMMAPACIHNRPDKPELQIRAIRIGPCLTACIIVHIVCRMKQEHTSPAPARASAPRGSVSPAARLARERRAAWALAWAGARRPLDALSRHYGGRRPGRIAAAVEALAGEDAAAGMDALGGLAAACARPGARPAPRAAIRKSAPPRRRAARRRNCLCCGAPFRSEGPHNRLCDPCRDEHADEPDDRTLRLSSFHVEHFIVEAPL